jgi:adenylosuccinate synthase
MRHPKAYLVIDGAWGSCGKGLLAGKLALDRNPDVVICNYGPNAGHTFVTPDGETVMTQQLPTGLVNRNSTLLIGPGSMVDPTILMREIEALDVKYGVVARLAIHPRAAVVLPKDKEREGALVKIGSTRKGTASAASRKMMRVDEGLPRIAREHPFLSRFVITEKQYDEMIRGAGLIQVESAQGVELSLNRGSGYPTCTGRDVTPEQIMNDVAVPIRFLAETCVVVRTFPIRVGNEYDKEGNEVGYSGPVYQDQSEITWETLSEMAGVQLLERTTVTKKVRRVFTFSEEQFHHAMWITGPCSIFLNYMNYLDPKAKTILDGNQVSRDFLDNVNKLARGHNSRVAWLGWGPAYGQVEEIGMVY